MTEKQQLYDTTATLLASVWTQDVELCERDFASWQLARVIDDWLVLYRDDPRVSVEQYRINCERLRALYVQEAQHQTA